MHRVAVVQMPHGDTLEQSLATARRLLDDAAARGARLALLPEYFFAAAGVAPGDMAPWAPRVRDFLLDASRALGVAVAGNVLEVREGALVNLGVVAEEGRMVLEQPKVHPMPREAAAGVTAGPRLRAAPVQGLATGMLVCADILYPEASRVLALQGARILLNPVMSPWREDDPTRGSREAIFVARAYDGGAFVLKAGGYRAPPAAHPVAGRSLIAAPWGVIARAEGDFTEGVVLADLDLDALERFRAHQRNFPARRPEAYHELVE